MGLRIIGGEYRGRRLSTVKGSHTRPTADRMRESLFNILRPHIPGAHVLDLFAGTGALGIEALSRGAASAVLIDMDAAALSVIHKNIEACRLGAKTRVIRCNIKAGLACVQEYLPPFDIVMMDPPYEAGLVNPALANLGKSRSLRPGALVVVEHSQHETIPDTMTGLPISDRRTYGRTCFTFLQFTPITEGNNRTDEKENRNLSGIV